MAPSPKDADGVFLEYFEPSITEILTLASFFFLLSISSWLSAKIFNAGPIGQMLVGMVYGVPVCNLLTLEWQQTFVSLGYVGLILIVFEGGLTINLDSMQKHAIMITISATISMMLPMVVSLAYLHVGLQYELVESFILGASLSSTSLGTTFVVISTVATDFDFSQTRLGTLLIGAVVLNDVVGLTMAAAIDGLGVAAAAAAAATSPAPTEPIFWIILRPIAASLVLCTVTPMLTTFLFGPVFRWFVEPVFARFKHVSNVILMAAMLAGFLALAALVGTSMLLGAFLAGTVLARLPCTHPDAPFMVLSRQHGETEPGKTPHFLHTFEKYFLGGQKYLLEPMFFASVGFGIPFKDLWSRQALCKGAVYAMLMLLSKVVLAGLIPAYDMLMRRPHPDPRPFVQRIYQPALIFGFGLAARGEIGLLTMQIGHNHTPYLTMEAFVVGIWAIILNTMAGPICVGHFFRAAHAALADDPKWGLPPLLPALRDAAAAADAASVRSARGRWTSRMHSRAVVARMPSRSLSRPRDVYAKGPRPRVGSTGLSAGSACAEKNRAVLPPRPLDAAFTIDSFPDIPRSGNAETRPRGESGTEPRRSLSRAASHTTTSRHVHIVDPHDPVQNFF